MDQALYRKWRPHLWDEVVGQEHVIHTLQNAIKAGKVGHAYLFAGPRGTGKTTTARLLAKAVNCLDEDPTNRPCDKCEHCIEVNEAKFMDLIEIDAASNTSVEDIRELRSKINYSPSKGKYKVYIIDEVHMLSNAAFNALLKTLEEPPAHAILILATTEVHRVLPTVLSRCQRHEFRRIPVEEIVKLLDSLATKEGIAVDQDALALIARQATGSMRDAISLLDQLQSSGEKVTLSIAQEVLGTAASQSVMDLAAALLARQAAEGMKLIHRAMNAGTDPRQFARQMVDYLRLLLLCKLGNLEKGVATTENRKIMETQAAQFGQKRLVSCIRLFQTAAAENSNLWLPGLMLELAIAQACSEEEISSSGTSKAGKPVISMPQVNIPLPAAPKTTPPAAVPKSTPVDQNADLPKAVPVPGKAAAASTSVETVDATPAEYQNVIPSWKRIREVVKKKKAQTEGLLNSIRSLTMKGDQLILGFGNELLKSKMEMVENIDITRKAVREVAGVDVHIVCIVASAKTSTPLQELGVDSDGLVSHAISQGGQVVHKD